MATIQNERAAAVQRIKSNPGNTFTDEQLLAMDPATLNKVAELSPVANTQGASHPAVNFPSFGLTGQAGAGQMTANYAGAAAPAPAPVADADGTEPTQNAEDGIMGLPVYEYEAK